jgi:hypothetical protein
VIFSRAVFVHFACARSPDNCFIAARCMQFAFKYANLGKLPRMIQLV